MSHRHEARVDDVSLGGCFVNTYGHVELHEPVELQIRMPSGEWLKLNGTVASSDPGVGFGMSFALTNAEEETAVKELIDSARESVI